MDSWKSFLLLNPLLSATTVIALSLRGWGDSDKPESSKYDITQYAEDVIQFMKAIKIEKVHLIGHSMGSIIGHYLGAHHPQYFQSLTLMGSAPKMPGGLSCTWCCYMSCFCECCCCPTYSLRDPNFLRGFQGVDSMIETSLISKEYAAILMEETYKATHTAIVKSFNGMMDDDHVNKIREIKLPTLLVWGTDDELFTKDDQADLQKLIKGSKLEIVNGGRHGVHWTHPEECAKKINAFLESI